MSDVRAKIEAAALRFARELADALEGAATASEWLDQKQSPLGRRRHLELVRAGVLRGRKEGRKVLVRRADIERYLEGLPLNQKTTDGDEPEDVLREMGLDASVMKRTG